MEVGYPGFVLDTYTVMLPAKRLAIVDRLSGAVQTILRKPDLRDKLRTAGLEATAGGPRLEARFARELPWQEVVAGITPQ